ncbi:hypothetical protein Zmor_020409 [Zophobas morio]|uniref:Uncharacterized protein n=1 Tax=Zophobas morio TaxID=2755281 RepID=A0AA38I3R2_9CUCU|nr:hypothetical protein Zmor_020409 [Zophobas morio]
MIARPKEVFNKSKLSMRITVPKRSDRETCIGDFLRWRRRRHRSPIDLWGAALVLTVQQVARWELGIRETGTENSGARLTSPPRKLPRTVVPRFLILCRDVQLPAHRISRIWGDG